MKETTLQRTTRELNLARLSEEKLRALLKMLPVGVSILGEDRKPIFTNLALENILGISEKRLQEGEYTQRKYLRADGSEMPASEFPSMRVFEEGVAIENVEIGIVKEDGEVIWTMVSAVPFVRDDWRVVLTVSDITQQKMMDNALQLRTAELTERVKELNCIYRISTLVEQSGITLEEILQGAVNLLPESWQYPENTCARITLDNQTYTSPAFRTSSCMQSCDLRVHSERRGSVEIFYLGSSQHAPFLKEEQHLLRAVAERLGRITERFRAEQLLLTLATTDPLTGLYNRRHFFELAEQEVARSIRYGHSLTCIMFDIDDFKDINDTAGHLFGDKVLQGMVRRCRENIREVDIFARYGGDEFIALLPETDLAHGKELAERLCTNFHQQPLKIDGREVAVTISLGVASMSGDQHLMLDILLNNADDALYEAKRRGRNQFYAWKNETTHVGSG